MTVAEIQASEAIAQIPSKLEDLIQAVNKANKLAKAKMVLEYAKWRALTPFAAKEELVELGLLDE